MNHQQEFDIPKKVDHLAAMLKGQATTRFVAVARPIVLRVPESTLADLDAMAKMAGKSRNAMAIHLLDAAIEEVRSTMDGDSIANLNELTTQVHVALQADVADREQLSSEE